MRWTPKKPDPWQRKFCFLPREIEGVVVWLEHAWRRSVPCSPYAAGLWMRAEFVDQVLAMDDNRVVGMTFWLSAPPVSERK